MFPWPRGARSILTELDHHPRSRAELIVLSGIADEDWAEAIRFLVDGGLAIRSGERRGTRYRRSSANGTAVVAPLAGAPSGSPVAAGYHGLLLEALGELDAMLSDGPGHTDPFSTQQKEPGCDEDDEYDEDGGDGGDGGDDDDEECTEEIVEIVALLRSRGATRVIDHRPRGGCLWVLDGQGVDGAVAAVAAAMDVRFYFKAEGARATNGHPAWWTKGG